LEQRRQRRAALVQLNALLRATAVTFTVQQQNVGRLIDSIERRQAKTPSLAKGYEQFLSDAFESMNAEERELHNIIRAMTVHMMRPLNQAILKWINGDTYFKSYSGWGDFGQLARNLAALELHLLMWNAKYEAWIPERPNHALVYLADESEHGIGFPNEIGIVLGRILTRQ
jgi:hypothetical protein